MQRHDFDGDSAISESESQTRHLTNSQNSVDFLARLENKMLVCCGPRLGKIFLTHKAMWICIVLSIIYYAIGIAYYASVEKWTLVTNIYFITISFLVSLMCAYLILCMCYFMYAHICKVDSVLLSSILF